MVFYVMAARADFCPQRLGPRGKSHPGGSWPPLRTRPIPSRRASMSLASDSRKHAEDWFKVAATMPPQERESALTVAEAWVQLAMDAEALESRPPTSTTVH